MVVINLTLFLNSPSYPFVGELQHPSRFEEAEQAWIWEYPLPDGQKHDLYMDVGEIIKIRVIDEEFVECEPNGPPSNENQPSTSQQTTENSKPPYRIIVSIFNAFPF